jgi:hypothetical protein
LIAESCIALTNLSIEGFQLKYGVSEVHNMGTIIRRLKTLKVRAPIGRGDGIVELVHQAPNLEELKLDIEIGDLGRFLACFPNLRPQLRPDTHAPHPRDISTEHQLLSNLLDSVEEQYIVP